MSQAITRCPACSTSFRVTEEQLRIAEGSVRCGACLHVFQAEEYFVSPLLDATERLAIEADYWSDFEAWLQMGLEPSAEPSAHGEQEPSAHGEQEPSAHGEQEPSAHSEQEPSAKPDYRESWAIEADLSTAGDSDAAGEREEDTTPVVHEFFYDHDHDHVPDARDINIQLETEPHHLVEDHRQLFSWRWVRWVPGALLMAGMLLVQYAWFNKDRLSQNLRYRDSYLDACRYLGCEIPAYHSPEELTTRELRIRSHPGEKDALVADVLLANVSDYPQRFPGLRLRFFDVKGTVVASRIFQVSEYLGGELRGLRNIPGRTEVRLSLELVDPGADAMGYEMDVIPEAPSL